MNNKSDYKYSMEFEHESVTDGFVHKISSEEGICRVKGVGIITISESVRELNMVMNHSDFNENLRFIVDLTEIRFNPSYTEIESIKNKLIMQKERLKNKIALVSIGTVSVIVYLIAQFGKHNGLKIKTFTTTENANQWLNETDELNVAITKQ